MKPFRALVVGSLIAAMPVLSPAVEEPDYQVIRKLGDVEIRQYAPYVVAQVVVAGPADEAGNQAFPILAGYIFGKNQGAVTFDMTAPVTQAAAPVRMAMTAPVTQTATGNGFVVQFVLPKGVTLASAPTPTDPRVQLDAIPSHRVAAIRYSGFWSQANYDEHLGKLQAALQADGIEWTGEPLLSRYDPPFMPWFMRRNEIWLNVPSPPPAPTAVTH